MQKGKKVKKLLFLAYFLVKIGFSVSQYYSLQREVGLKVKLISEFQNSKWVSMATNLVTR